MAINGRKYLIRHAPKCGMDAALTKHPGLIRLDKHSNDYFGGPK